MQITTLKTTILFLATALMTCHSGAQLMMCDAFHYANGALVGAVGSPWVANYETPEAMVVSGGRLFLTQDSEQSVRWDFPTVLNSGEIFARMRVTFTELPRGNGNFFAFFRQKDVDNLRGRLWVSTNGAAADKFRLGCVTIAGEPAMIAADLSLQTPYLVVLRYNLTNSTTTLWIDPSSETDTAMRSDNVYEPGILPLVKHFGFKQMAAFENQEHTMGSLYVDHVLVGRTFADVARPGVIMGIQPAGGGNFQIQAEGLRGATYVLQGGVQFQWSSMVTNTAGSQGVLQYNHVTAPGVGQGLFRLSTTP
jgi:hypothetical protein